MEVITVKTIDTLEQKLLSTKAQIGNTPLIRISGVHYNPDVRIFVKARAAFNSIPSTYANKLVSALPWKLTGQFQLEKEKVLILKSIQV